MCHKGGGGNFRVVDSPRSTLKILIIEPTCVIDPCSLVALATHTAFYFRQPNPLIMSAVTRQSFPGAGMKLIMVLKNGFRNMRTDHGTETKTFIDLGVRYSHLVLVGDNERTGGGHPSLKNLPLNLSYRSFNSSIMNMTLRRFG